MLINNLINTWRNFRKGKLTSAINLGGLTFGISFCRKVLGANAASVFQLLSKDVVLLILLAFAIANPFSWWVSDRWLQSFEYRVDLKWWIFAEAGLITAVIAGISVGSQVIRSALANPVTCLRSE